MLEADPSASMAYSKSDPGSNLSQQQRPGPNLNSNTSGEEGQDGPPPNEVNNRHDPVADTKGGLDSRQPSPQPNPDSSTSGEDQVDPPPDEGNNPLDQDANAEDGLEGSKVSSGCAA